MIRNNISMTIKTLKGMRDNPAKDTIDFNSPIQRKSGMWDEKRKSLLIHSILMSSIFSVPTVYFRKDMIAEKKYQYSVIDGIQRITTVFSYIDNEFALGEVPPAILDGVVYEVSGKYFSDLEQDCQQEIIRFKMRIEAFEPEDGDTEEYVNDMIEQVFERLNSAVPLTSAQLCKAKAGTDVAILLNELLASKFFTESCNFTKGQLKASDDQRCLLQAMMLLDRNYVSGFEVRDFSETSIMEYAESIKGNYTDKQSNLLKAVVQYLTEAFPEKNKNLKKISIPILLYLADIAEDFEIKPMYFRQWWECFTEEDVLFEYYKGFCGSGSTKLPFVDGRLSVMVKSFSVYHEVDIPDELIDIVAKTEKILEERRLAQQAQLEAEALENTDNQNEGTEVEDMVSYTEEISSDVESTAETEETSLVVEDVIETDEADSDMENVYNTVENADTEEQSSDEASSI